MGASDVTISSDYDGLDGVQTGEVTLVLSGTIASGDSYTDGVTFFHNSAERELVEVFVRQSVSGYNNREEPIPPHEWVYVPATGAGVPAAGIDCHFAIKTNVVTTRINVRISNGTGSNLTLTTNTLTFRYVLSELPWEAINETTTNVRGTSGGDRRVTDSGGIRTIV